MSPMEGKASLQKAYTGRNLQTALLTQTLLVAVAVFKAQTLGEFRRGQQANKLLLISLAGIVIPAIHYRVADVNLKLK